MEVINGLSKTYYCALKVNRLVDDTGGVEKYKRIDELEWSALEQQHDKLIKVRGFPKDKKVKLFRVIVSTDKSTMWSQTISLNLPSHIVQQVCNVRWKIVACFPQGGVSPRAKAANWSGSLSVLQGPDSAKPDCLYPTGLGAVENNRLSNSSKHLQS